MSSNNKRCSSGTTPSARSHSLSSIKQISTLSRSKTCGVTQTVLLKSKPERLQPLTTNKPTPIDDKTLLDEINCPHPAMVNELCLHAKGFLTIPNLSQFSKLQILDLSCNSIIRIENLRNLSNLRELKLYGNKIERIENLECLTQLQTLQLQYNEIQSIGFNLAYQTRLQTLRLDSNKLSSIRSDELAKLSQLKMLDISNCSIENLDFLNVLSSLTEFQASYCHLTILPNQFRNLRNLVDLDLSNNQLVNLNSLKTLSSLRILKLSNNHIQDLHILSFLVHLNELDVSSNRISIIPTSFEKLIDLQYLNISNNQIQSWNDINILKRMTSLFILTIHDNPFLFQLENSFEKLSEFCPLLEIIDDISLRNEHSPIMSSESNEQLMSIDKELKEIDQSLERSMLAIEAQFNRISTDLEKLNEQNKELSNEPTSLNKKSKHRLFQALTFSEENYLQ